MVSAAKFRLFTLDSCQSRKYQSSFSVSDDERFVVPPVLAHAESTKHRRLLERSIIMSVAKF